MHKHLLPMERGRRLAVLAIVTFAASVTLVSVARADDLTSTEFLADLSLEALLSTEITTWLRKSESFGSAPAAVHVISQSDIRRSGE